MKHARSRTETITAESWSPPVIAGKCDGRWFLANERGELVEKPFAEVVEWLDTLWDIRQLAPAR
ncbi:MAG TPA: hypothetical protein VMH50_08500 [Thermoleophilia bacterium]|nr:hypothetical protein [Thermoleophilia bacterium]